jgi:hypothetical protein
MSGEPFSGWPDTADPPPSRPMDASASLAVAFGGGGKVRTTQLPTPRLALQFAEQPPRADQMIVEDLAGDVEQIADE